MSGDQRRSSLEHIEGGGQLRVPLVRRDEERIVRGHLARRLPHALHRHELGRVRREPMQLDQMPALAQPAHSILFEAMAGRVVDDQEYLAALVATDELSQEFEEGLAVEHRRELEREFRAIEGDRTEHMRGLAQAIGVNTRLHTDA